MLRQALVGLLFSALCLFSGISSALQPEPKETIMVGLAHFPPFIVNQENEVGGLAMEMLELLNQHQNRFQFKAFPTLANTRHKLFELERYDMSMFDSLSWGWQKLEVDESIEYLKGGEVYIAQNLPGRDQSYFTDFKNKTMIGLLGYHYGFADFNSDPEYLKSNYNMILTKSNLGSIQKILLGNRGDIALVTKSYLAQYLNANPHDRANILISEKEDQQYSHRIILRKGINLHIDDINTWLKELEHNGKLSELWQKIRTQL